MGPRSSKLPGVPTWNEANFHGPAYENLPECNMLFARKDTPAALVEQIALLVRSSYAESERIQSVRETLGDEEPALIGPELQAFIQRTWPTFRALTKAAGLAAS